MAIAAVACLRDVDAQGQRHIGFIMGKSKLAPKPVHTIPHLDLSAAVLAVEMADVIVEETDAELQATKFYTDSKIMLGYIHNTTWRFHVYISNRVAHIRKSTDPEQWHFISTEHNPVHMDPDLYLWQN